MRFTSNRSVFSAVFTVALLFARTSRAQATNDDDELVVPSAPATDSPATPGTPATPAAPEQAPASPPAVPEAPANAPTAPASPQPANPSADANAELLARITNLENDVKAAREESKASMRLVDLLAPFAVTGYLQTEYQTSQASEDQLGQGGVLLNRDRFTLRRARVRLDGDYKYAALQMETDGNTKSGPEFRMLHAFGTLKLPGADRSVPLAAVTMGLFDTPFGNELTESPRLRWFMERSTASQAFYASEPDVGVKFHGGIGFVRWDIAVMNGEPLGNKNGFPGLSPHAAKDVLFRIGVDTHPREDLAVSGHISALRGKGFHPGSDATKATIQWNDANEDGAVQSTELSGIPARSATPSQLFDRWAVGADLQLQLRTALGLSSFNGEVVIASNLDRTLFVADPVVTGVDSRELGFLLGVTQEITKWGVVGFRFDHYDPNANFFDKRGGKLIPTSQAINTFSPMIGAVLPDPSLKDRARLLLQYDIIKDKLARDSRGLPTDLKNNVLTLRLQVSL
ncbi:MAG: hypothetical protein FWD73_09805 [Polyangiaceae bacterium]|nr:hypothetical protein [Polyangiaceae bacterium]